MEAKPDSLITKQLKRSKFIKGYLVREGCLYHPFVLG
jgi:hypothetical protein